jgi:hypothetical protein
MKIVCVRKGGDKRTLLKVYDSIEKFDILNDQWWFYNDDGEITRAWYKDFIPLSEWRDKRINEILED